MNIIEIFIAYKIYLTIFCLCAISGFIAYSGYNRTTEISSYSTWIKGDSITILESKINKKTTTTKKNGKTTETTKYVPYIKYKYKYNNKEYSNDEISSIGASFTTEADATTYLNKYNSDSQNVYFDPQNPEDSYLYLDTNETVSTTYFIISNIINCNIVIHF